MIKIHLGASLSGQFAIRSSILLKEKNNVKDADGENFFSWEAKEVLFFNLDGLF